MKVKMLTSSVVATALLLNAPQSAIGQFPTAFVSTPFPNNGGVGSHGVAVDSNGIVWYVPVGSSLVRQDPSFAPGNAAGITIIALPHPAVNLAIDTSDNVWISCSDGFVTKFDPAFNTFTNFGPVGPCLFLDHIHFHSDGNVYTTCLDGAHIIRVNQPAGTIDIFLVPTAGSATSGVTGDFTGDLWIIERSAHNVVRGVLANMVPNTFMGVTEFAIPNAPYSPETVKGCLDRIWFTGLTDGPNGPRVDYIDINTTGITIFDVDPGNSGGTYGLAVDGNGNPWATNPSNPKIYGIEIATNMVSIFPTPSPPHHIAISPTTGNLWYTDFQARVVQMVPDVPISPTCEATEPPAGDLDIKPGSCPNSFNRNSHGVLPVALVGTAGFDVNDVDLGSLLLCRKDQQAGCVAPNFGPPGPHPTIDDVATPFEGDEQCDCHEETGDGIDDLMLHFRTDDVVANLDLNSFSPGALVSLTLTGELNDGTAFEVDDCVRLVPPGTPPGMLAVHSNVTDAWIALSPIDNQLDGGGFATFVRTFPLSSVVTLTAPKTQNGWSFEGWKLTSIAFGGLPDDPPGGLIPGRNLVLTIDSVLHTVEAIYALPDWELAPDLGGGSNVGTASEPGAEAPEREAPSGKGS